MKPKNQYDKRSKDLADKDVRHILGLSGGKDSTALALYLKKEIPDIEYFFCDTHKELPETYEYIDKLEIRLGKKINRLESNRGFDHWLDVYDGFLPNPRSRWCTKKLKIEPLEKFIGNDKTISYIAIRADEDRVGYISTRNNIKPVFPFMRDGLVKSDIYRIIEESGIGLPDYYTWRTRSGCFFCFFQRKIEWVRLSEIHPELFEEALKYEQRHSDGRTYYWSSNESLDDLIRRKNIITEQYLKKKAKNIHPEKGRTLFESLGSIIEEEPDLCFHCHL